MQCVLGTLLNARKTKILKTKRPNSGTRKILLSITWCAVSYQQHSKIWRFGKDFTELVTFHLDLEGWAGLWNMKEKMVIPCRSFGISKGQEAWQYLAHLGSHLASLGYGGMVKHRKEILASSKESSVPYQEIKTYFVGTRELLKVGS